MEHSTFGTFMAAKSSKAVEVPERFAARAIVHPQAAPFAWKLHVELRTRIATRRLAVRSGDDRSALQSLHDLYQRTRALVLKAGPDGGEVADVVLDVTNAELRRVLDDWHPVFSRGPLGQPEEAGNFREDLYVLKDTMVWLAHYLGAVARGDGYDPTWAKDLTRRPAEAPAARPVRDVPADVTKLIDIEKGSIARWRRLAERKSTDLEPIVGLALSGGGIRSATFAAGVLGILSKAGMHRSIDYLSTVSGGGYIGTLISTWSTSLAALRGREVDESKKEKMKDLLLRGPFHAHQAMEHLRNRSRYLIEGGFVGMARALLPVALGMLAAASTVFATTLFTLLLVAAFFYVGEHIAQRGVGVLLGLGLMLVWAYRVRSMREFLQTPIAMFLSWLALLAAPGVAVSLLGGLWSLVTTLRPSAIPMLPEGLAAALPPMLTAAGTWLMRSGRLPGLAKVVLAASPWVAYAIGLTILSRCLDVDGIAARTSAIEMPAWADLTEAWRVYVVTLGASFFFAAVLDVNAWSPHGYYRDRLAETYCLDVTAEGEVTSAKKPPDVTDLQPLAPVHLINATVNLPGTSARNDRGRRAYPMTFSREGWLYPVLKDGMLVPKLATMDGTLDRGRQIDVATAMAVSGAAVAPLLGTSTPNGATPWLSLLNLRLSVWLRTPGKDWRYRLALPSGAYVLRELIQRVREDLWRINVSDGGHFENLGAYELIRRRCGTIVIIDGEEDSTLRCEGLMTLMRLVRIDFGAEIDIDVSAIHLDDRRFSGAHAAVGKIRYGRQGAETQAPVGTLVYIKLSMTGREPGWLLSYRDREPAFPHHGTVTDQLYSEEQFEAYRRLGAHIAESLLDVSVVGDDVRGACVRGDLTMATWATALDESLYRKPLR